MEFLSEDIYGGYYSGLPEAQPWNTMQGLTSPYGVYGLNQAGLLAQQSLPVTAAGGLNIGVNIDEQGIRDQVNQNLGMLTNNSFEQPDFNTIEPDTFEIESLQEFNKFVEDTLRQEEYQRFIADNFYDTSDLDEGAETVEFNDMEDDTFQMILDSILGQAEDIPPEIRGDELKTQQFIREQLAILASQQGNNEQIVDPNESTLPPNDLEDEIGVNPDMPITDPQLDPLDEITTDQEAEENEETESWLDRLNNWWNNVLSGGSGGGASSSTPPTLPGSAGVIISPGSAGMTWPDILTSPGKWTVYLPGVIPGLPQSPTIIGTIEDILSKPEEVFDGLLKDLENTVSNPGQVLEDLLNDAADSDGLITIGGIAGVVNGILDRIGDSVNRDPDGNIIVNEDGSVVGGKDDDEEGEEGINLKEKDKVPDDVTPLPEIGGDIPISDSPKPEPDYIKEIKDKDKVPDEVTPLPEVEGDIPINDSPEPQPETGFDDTEDTEDAASAGGGGGGGPAKAKKFMDVIPYQPVAVPELILPNQSVNYSPVPVRSSRDEFLRNSVVASLFEGLY